MVVKTIKEKCTIITGHPESQCNSLWNNIQKEKCCRFLNNIKDI